MSLPLRLLFTILTTLTFIVCLIFAIIGFVKAVPILAVTCLMLAAGCGYFVYNDIKFYLSNQTTSK